MNHAMIAALTQMPSYWLIEALSLVREVKARGRRVMFVGNGGSAAIASHMAADWMKNGDMKTLCFNDAASLTALANDTGYANVFMTPLSYHGQRDDLLIAISSSGESDSILRAANMARMKDMKLITLSGFKCDNRLRNFGDVRVYVQSENYGIVETAHLAWLHALLDAVNGNLVTGGIANEEPARVA